jgi:hypothetical protein
MIHKLYNNFKFTIFEHDYRQNLITCICVKNQWLMRKYELFVEKKNIFDILSFFFLYIKFKKMY